MIVYDMIWYQARYERAWSIVGNVPTACLWLPVLKGSEPYQNWIFACVWFANINCSRKHSDSVTVKGIISSFLWKSSVLKSKKVCGQSNTLCATSSSSRCDTIATKWHVCPTKAAGVPPNVCPTRAVGWCPTEMARCPKFSPVSQLDLCPSYACPQLILSWGTDLQPVNMTVKINQVAMCLF